MYRTLRGTLPFLLLASLVPGAALAAPWDDQPKILLHIRGVTTSSACANYGALGDCHDAVTGAGLTTQGEGPWFFVYLLGVHASAMTGISEIRCGITYQNGESGGQNDHVGIDVLAWRRCATIDAPSTGVPEWPSPGSGNTINWDLPESCQEGETAVAGYFYLGAYSGDLLQLTVEPTLGQARLRSCGGEFATLDPDRDLGGAAFTAGAVESGCNPCDGSCDGMPVTVATWGRIKALITP